MELETDIEDIPEIEEFDYTQSGIVEEEFSEKPETYNCKTFNKLTELSKKVKGILYKLLFVFQSSDVTIVNTINEYYNNITKYKYTPIQQSNKVRIEAFTYNDSYYYIIYNNI
jgi:hypothetical protein